MDRSTIAVMILIGAIAIARFVSEAGLKALAAEQKGLLVEGLAPVRKYGLLAVLALVVIGYKIPIVIAVGIVSFIAINQAFIFRQAKRLSLPATYMRSSLTAAAISAAGICAYIYAIFSPAWA